MFGRHPRLPIDLAFGISKDTMQPVGSYVKNLRDRLTHAYQLATEASRNAQVRQKEGYDIKVRGATIQKGDRVLMKEVSFDGKHKLADTWENGTGFGFSCGISCSLINPTGKRKFL
jgi:Fe-S cluster assembly ATPase SufC